MPSVLMMFDEAGGRCFADDDEALRGARIDALRTDGRASISETGRLVALELSPGTRLGKYRILGPLGFGGRTSFPRDLGCRRNTNEPSVYRAQDKVLDRLVALKVLRASCRNHEMCRWRLEREAVALARLKHPNIPSALDIDVPFLAMQLVEGTTLAALEHRADRFEPHNALTVLCDVASALDYLHAQGVEHRNISPDNILIEGDVLGGPGRARAYLADFCCCHLVQMVAGTSLDRSHDLYSFAVVAYEMLAGRRPFEETSNLMALYYRLTHEDAPQPCSFNPALPATYDAIFARALSRNREERPKSAGEFVQALTEGLSASLH